MFFKEKVWWKLNWCDFSLEHLIRLGFQLLNSWLMTIYFEFFKNLLYILEFLRALQINLSHVLCIQFVQKGNTDKCLMRCTLFHFRCSEKPNLSLCMFFSYIVKTFILMHWCISRPLGGPKDKWDWAGWILKKKLNLIHALTNVYSSTANVVGLGT